ncbi:lysozyme inhibitor LprI family protein [Granulicella sibirica]|uniref:lysozyme inhibitor LprI family protein n=1 Tax=Granulicella sibirica TaxID=2479048 RepID=UPI001008E762|nr:lysozyme inhibitor LprI family protein [Granulicella sibirica]
MKSILIGFCAVLTCGLAVAQNPSEFAATDAKLQACVDRDSSNMHIMACNSVAQMFADARLNNVYQAWTEVLKHPKPDEAKDDAEILKRLVAAERAWITFRDTDCSLQSTSMLGGTGESNA